MGDARATSEDQMMSDVVIPIQNGVQKKVCEDCGRTWVVECDYIDINLCIHLQKYENLESNPLFLTVLRETPSANSSPSSLASPAQLTCIVVGGQDKFVYKWKVNHNGRGTPAYSGCQITPILRSDCNTKDSLASGCNGGSPIVMNHLHNERNELSNNSIYRKENRLKDNNTEIQESFNSTSYMLTNRLERERRLNHNDADNNTSTTGLTVGMNNAIKQNNSIEKYTKYRSVDENVTENEVNCTYIGDTTISSIGEIENRNIIGHSNNSDAFKTNFTVDSVVKKEKEIIEVKEEFVMEESLNSSQSTEAIYAEPFDAAAWVPETLITTRGLELSRSPQETFQCNNAVSPVRPDQLKLSSNPMGSCSNVIDSCQYTIQHILDFNPSSSSSSKRSCQERMWKRDVAKIKRNLGIEYVSPCTQKIVAARQIGPPCTCHKECYKQVGEDMIQELFTNFWSLGDWNLQTAYLKQSSISTEVKRKTLNKTDKFRKCHVKYFVKVSNRDRPLQVCKQGFCNMHSISLGRIDKAFNSVATDQRGKHVKRSRKIKESRVNLAVTHMISVSSISDTDSSGQERVRNKKHMYEMYTEWLQEYHPTEVPVSNHFYLDTLRTTLPNLNFPIYGTEINYVDSLKCETNLEANHENDLDPVLHCVVNLEDS